MQKTKNTKSLEGKKAPSFCLKNQDGKKICLKDLLGSLSANGYLLVYFYPKDSTPGCTKEAQGFSELKRKLKNKGLEVVGISILDEESKKRFAEKYKIKINLLADPEHKIAEKYGVWKEKICMAKNTLALQEKASW